MEKPQTMTEIEKSKSWKLSYTKYFKHLYSGRRIL